MTLFFIFRDMAAKLGKKGHLAFGLVISKSFHSFQLTFYLGKFSSEIKFCFKIMPLIFIISFKPLLL